jgi:predicted nuclease of predicted toxin-antitoxin system
MRFLVDAQLPPALARWLAERGHDAEHVFDQRLAAADGRVIWDYAVATDAVIVTKDEADRR